MKKILSTYILGARYLLSDDDIGSFYVFFTLAFASCAWFLSYRELSISIPSVIVMIGYVTNIMVFSWLKGNSEGTRLEKVFGICYMAVFAIFFIIGSIISFRDHIIIMTIVLATTFIAAFSEYFIFEFVQALMLFLPFLILVFAIAHTSLPIILKLIIPLVYTMCTPFIAYYEDNAAAQNIFELAYEYTWSTELEKYRREINSKNQVV